MRKFTFQKESIAVRSDYIGNTIKLDEWEDEGNLDVEQAAINEAHERGIREERSRRKVYKQQLKELKKPFAVLDGQTFDFYHHSLPEYKNNRDELGNLKVHEIKKKLSAPGSGYKEVFLPLTSYAYNEDWARLAPNGLRAFVPEDTPGTFWDAKGATKELQSARATAKLDTTSQESSKPIVEAGNPLDMWENEGPEAMLQAVTLNNRRPSQTKSLSDLSRSDLCVCGRSKEDHSDRRHEFTPQFNVKEDGSLVPASKFRAGQSELLYATLPQNPEDDGSDPSTKWVKKIADEGADRPLMPVITMGLNAAKLDRTTLEPTGLDQKGEPIKPVDYVDDKEKEVTSYPLCPGQVLSNGTRIPCYKGYLSPDRSINSTFCGDCVEGQPLYSQDGSREIGVGLGNGRIRIYNQEDCPPHADCDGAGYVYESNGAGEEIGVPCKGCNKTGKDLSALSSTTCGNCHTKGTIQLTDNNQCPVCSGKGRVPVQITKSPKSMPVEQTAPITRRAEGNVAYLDDFDTSGYGETGIDGWKAHGDPDCPTCSGDDEYQEVDAEGNATPCKNCRIGSFSDSKSLIAPKGARFIGPTGIKVPLSLFQRALSRIYGGANAIKNPHSFETDHEAHRASKYDENGGKRVSYSVITDGGRTPSIDRDDFVGILMPGYNLTGNDIQELNARSKKHRSSVNAKFCAASAELEDINEMLTNRLSAMPMNIPGVQVNTPKVRNNTNGQLDASTLHPRTQEALSKITEAMRGLGLPEGSLSRSLPGALESASQIEHASDSGVQNDEAMNKYEESMNQLIGDIALNHTEHRAPMRNILKETMPSSPILEKPVEA